MSRGKAQWGRVWLGKILRRVINMVLSIDEMKEFEVLKQNHKKELIELDRATTIAEHTMKMERLEKMHKMVLDGWKGRE